MGSKRHLNRAAALLTPIVDAGVSQAVALIVDAARGEGPRPMRRPRGRGSELTLMDRMAVLTALTFLGSVGQVATLCGYDRRTVARIARSQDYKTLQLLVAERLLERRARKQIA